MNQLKAPSRYTPEDLLTLPDGHHYELIDDQLVERNMGAEASLVAANLIALLGAHVHPQKLGHVFASDCGYQIFPDQPNRVRYADGSFIARGRFPNERVPRGHVRIPPDLAMEVVSPNDLAEEVEGKVEDYLRAGIRLLWVLYPNTQTVYVFRRDGSVSRLTRASELSGEDVIPGFVCRVEDLFPSTPSEPSTPPS
jgi:Uma2 family endonuclease